MRLGVLWGVGLATGLMLIAPAPGWATTAEDLQAEVWTFKCENAFDQALKTAEALLEWQQAEGAPDYDLAYAGVQVDLIRRILTLDSGAREELARAYALNGAITAAHDNADYAEGLRLCREQYAVYLRYLGEQSLDSVYILGGMALFSGLLGDYAGAMDLYEDCLTGMRALLGEEHPQVAMHLNNLAGLYANLGDYARAEELMQEAMVLRSRALGPEHPQVAQSLNNLAVLARRRGDNLKAEALYHRALAIYRREPGTHTQSVARILNNLGVLLYEQKDLLGATEYLEEALDLRERTLSPDHADVAVSLMSVAKLRSDQGRAEEARELSARALAIRRETFGDPHPRVADTYLEMAVMARDQGRLEEAEGLVHRALAIWESFWGADHPKVAEGWVELARIQRGQDRFPEAVESYRKALAVLEQQDTVILPREVEARIGLAEVLQFLGRFPEARTELEQAAQKYELARVRAGSALRRDWVLGSPYPRLAAARLLDGERNEAWSAYEAGLSRKLADLVLDLDLRPLSKEQKLRQTELLRAVERAQEKLDALHAYKTGTSSEREQYDQIRGTLIQAEGEWIAWQEKAADRQSPLTAGTPSLAAIQASLTPDTAIIGWLDVPLENQAPHAAVFVVRSSGDVTWANLGPASGAEALRRKLQVAGEWPFRLAPDADLDRLAHRVWEQRVAPVAGALRGVSRLVVIPSGAMREIPVEMLPSANGHTVGETYIVSYAPSATLYSWLVRRDPARRLSGEKTALLVGDPVFHPRGESPAATLGLSEEVVFRSALAGNSEALDELPPLPGSRREVELLSGILGRVTSLTGTEATESNIVSLAGRGELEEFQILHLATHALVDPDQPARSALVLSRSHLPDPVESALRGERVDDGLLTVREILTECPMDADLVTLSACRTAFPGPGMDRDNLGLAAAFLQAGARNLLVSLWPVDDQATMRLMTRFYADLLGSKDRPAMTKGKALVEAKTWLRSYTGPDGSRPFAHPVYWAGFVLVGAGD